MFIFFGFLDWRYCSDPVLYFLAVGWNNRNEHLLPGKTQGKPICSPTSSHGPKTMLLEINRENLHLPFKSQTAKSGLREVQPRAKTYEAQRGFCTMVLSASFSVYNAALVGLWAWECRVRNFSWKHPWSPVFVSGFCWINSAALPREGWPWEQCPGGRRGVARSSSTQVCVFLLRLSAFHTSAALLQQGRTPRRAWGWEGKEGRPGSSSRGTLCQTLASLSFRAHPCSSDFCPCCSPAPSRSPWDLLALSWEFSPSVCFPRLPICFPELDCLLQKLS